MGIEVSWRSQAGVRTGDNRDHGGIGIRGNETLCIIADGSSTASKSGALAQAIIRELVDWYVVSDQALKPEVLLVHLSRLHESLSKQHRCASASYMIVYIRADGTGIVLHAGDCLLGQCNDEGAIKWLNRPHTLANATSDIPITVVASLPERHRLTRSFRSREFVAPDIGETRIEKELLLVTDGFWAELQPEDQLRFIEGNDIPMLANGDDCSVLRVRVSNSVQDGSVRIREALTGNFYARCG